MDAEAASGHFWLIGIACALAGSLAAGLAVWMWAGLKHARVQASHQRSEFRHRESELRLAEAQRIAQIGSWHRDLLTGAMRPWFARALAGEAVTFELSDTYAGIHRRSIQVQLVPDRGRDGMICGMFAMITDVSERARQDGAAAHARRLEAMGRLAGGIAHDFNNNLSVIIGNLDLAQRAAPSSGEPDDAWRLVGEAARVADRCADLTGRLLTFSRRQSLVAGDVDANALIDNLEPILMRTLGGHIAVHVTGAPALWSCLADRGELENALLNLVINARDAMPDGGTLTIKTANVEVGAAGSDNLPDGLEPGDYVLIAVGDTGTGIEDEHLGSVFEPYFTTKSPDAGTGLGLAMVYGFARQSGGIASIDTMAGHGTTVNLYLPRSSSAAPAPAVSSPVAEDRPEATPEMRDESGLETNGEERTVLPLRGEGELILVVDGDAGMRQVLTQQLAALGYRVVEAADGERALGVLARGEAVDLVLAEHVMPGSMGGLALRQAINARYPEMPVVLMSGLGAEPEPAADKGEEGIVLAKPCSRRVLSEALRRALDGTAKPPVAPNGPDEAAPRTGIAAHLRLVSDRTR